MNHAKLKRLEVRRFEVSEKANEAMFVCLYPNAEYKINPFGSKGLDAFTKHEGVRAIEEWKFNSGPYDRLHNQGNGYLLEETKYKKLVKAGDNLDAVPIMRKFFEDAELMLIIDFEEKAIAKYHNEKWCETTQFSGVKSMQPGYYIPLGTYWKVRHYTQEEKDYYQKVAARKKQILDEITKQENALLADSRLEMLKNLDR